MRVFVRAENKILSTREELLRAIDSGNYPHYGENTLATTMESPRINAFSNI